MGKLNNTTKSLTTGGSLGPSEREKPASCFSASLAVIVGRFQTAKLTIGHQMLLHHAYANAQHVLIVVGSANTRLCVQNPLSFSMRKQMLKAYLGPLMQRTTILELHDQKSNEVWSQNLDKLILSQEAFHTYTNAALSTKKKNVYRSLSDGIKPNIVIFTGRDGFNKGYHGKYQVQVVNFNLDSVNASHHRKQLHNSVKNNPEWRAGVIYASKHKYPTSFQTVDVAVICHHTKRVLLGRKKHEKNYRFIGGFVDPSDESLEMAAKREVMEETGGLETDGYQYISSYRIDDWRYRRGQDKIMTAFFACHYIFGAPEATDDIAELKWIKLTTLKASDVEPEHQQLLLGLKTNFKNGTLN